MADDPTGAGQQAERRGRAPRPGAEAGRLILLCGLPGAGKTTTALRLAAELPAVRLCPDAWLAALGLDLFDGDARDRVERQLWCHGQELLRLGGTVVLENGFWQRAERDAYRDRARALGAAVELRHLDVPVAELWRRVERRNRSGEAGTVPLSRELIAACARDFEAPDAAELASYDPPFTRTVG